MATNVIPDAANNGATVAAEPVSHVETIREVLSMIPDGAHVNGKAELMELTLSFWSAIGGFDVLTRKAGKNSAGEVVPGKFFLSSNKGMQLAAFNSDELPEITVGGEAVTPTELTLTALIRLPKPGSTKSTKAARTAATNIGKVEDPADLDAIEAALKAARARQAGK